MNRLISNVLNEENHLDDPSFGPITREGKGMCFQKDHPMNQFFHRLKPPNDAVKSENVRLDGMQRRRKNGNPLFSNLQMINLVSGETGTRLDGISDNFILEILQPSPFDRIRRSSELQRSVVLWGGQTG